LEGPATGLSTGVPTPRPPGSDRSGRAGVKKQREALDLREKLKGQQERVAEVGMNSLCKR